MTTKTINLAAMLIGSAFLATSPVQAKTFTDSSGAKLRAVNYADLDLATSGGRAKLNRRVALAIESVCGSYANLSVEEQDEVSKCRRGAQRKLAPQLARLLKGYAPA